VWIVLFERGGEMVKDTTIEEMKHALSDLFNLKQAAWHNQNDKWEHLQTIWCENGQWIEQLNLECTQIMESRPAKRKALDKLDEKIWLLFEEIRLAGDAHMYARDEFRIIKKAFNLAKNELQSELQIFKDENPESCRAMARRAGVLKQYWHDVIVSYKPNDTATIYFGGVGRPDGYGCGHYIMRLSDGKVLRKKTPSDNLDGGCCQVSYEIY
jgi:hypothetical protein